MMSEQKAVGMRVNVNQMMVKLDSNAQIYGSSCYWIGYKVTGAAVFPAYGSLDFAVLMLLFQVIVLLVEEKLFRM